MDTNKIKEEMQREGIVDNPFDLMMVNAIELTRMILFASHRYKNHEVCEVVDAYKNPKIISVYMECINDELKKLANVSEETVTLCQRTSKYYIELNSINEKLFEFSKTIPTLYTCTVPCRNDEFEKIRLGEDSECYRRIVELRELCHIAKFDSHDIDRMKEILSSEKDFEHNPAYHGLENLMKKYHLTYNDVSYMESYINK